MKTAAIHNEGCRDIVQNFQKIDFTKRAGTAKLAEATLYMLVVMLWLPYHGLSWLTQTGMHQTGLSAASVSACIAS